MKTRPSPDGETTPAPPAGRGRRPARRLLSGATASTVMALGLFKYVDPWLIEDDTPAGAGPVANVPRPRDGSEA